MLVMSIDWPMVMVMKKTIITTTIVMKQVCCQTMVWYLKDTSDVKRSPGFCQVESPIEVEVPQVPDSAPRGRAQHVHHRLGEDKVQE